MKPKATKSKSQESVPVKSKRVSRDVSTLRAKAAMGPKPPSRPQMSVPVKAVPAPVAIEPEVVAIVDAPEPQPELDPAEAARQRRLLDAREFAEHLADGDIAAMNKVRSTTHLKSGEECIGCMTTDRGVTRANRLVQRLGGPTADDSGAIVVPVLLWDKLDGNPQRMDMPAYTPILAVPDAMVEAAEAAIERGDPATKSAADYLADAKKARKERAARAKCLDPNAPPKEKKAKAPRAPRQRDARLPEPGTVLEHKDKDGKAWVARTTESNAVVVTMEDGTERTFTSISAAGAFCNGTRSVNGYIYFGILKTAKRPPKVKSVDELQAMLAKAIARRDAADARVDALRTALLEAKKESTQAPAPEKASAETVASVQDRVAILAKNKGAKGKARK